MLTKRLKAWSRHELALSPEQAASLAESDLVLVQPRPSPGMWEVRTESRIGIVRGSDLEIRVEPHLPIPRLMFLLGYAADPKGWRSFSAGFTESEELWPAITNGFATHALKAIEPSPLRGYVTRDEQATAFRGRVRHGRQIARSFGLPLPLHLTFDDFELDVPENRFLYTAARFLLRFPALPGRLRHRLRRICLELDGVSEIPVPLRTQAPALTRLNRHYSAALRLAELILSNASVSGEAGRTLSIGFNFDMNRVFEDFVSTAMVVSGRRLGRSVSLQYSRKFLDEGRHIRLIPDITWWQNGRCTGVADAKYKELSSRSLPNADAYQMLAYCIALGIPSGYLIYARDDLAQPMRDHHISEAAVTIHVRSLDLTAEPDDLLGQVDRLALNLADLTRARDVTQ